MFYAYYLGVLVASLFVTLDFKGMDVDDDSSSNNWFWIGLGIGFGFAVIGSWITVFAGFYKRI